MSIDRIFLISLGWVWAATVKADDAASQIKFAGKTSTAPDMVPWLLGLMFVLAIFFALVWLLRKSGGLSMLGKGQLTIITGLSLGMREKLVLVKVGEKQLLLGVTAGRIDKLLELEGDQRLFVSQESEKENPVFAEKLMQIMQGKTNV